MSQFATSVSYHPKNMNSLLYVSAFNGNTILTSVCKYISNSIDRSNSELMESIFINMFSKVKDFNREYLEVSLRQKDFTELSLINDIMRSFSDFMYIKSFEGVLYTNARFGQGDVEIIQQDLTSYFNASFNSFIKDLGITHLFDEQNLSFDETTRHFGAGLIVFAENTDCREFLIGDVHYGTLESTKAMVE